MADTSRNELIEIRFVGGDIRPARVRAGDLAMVLAATEQLVEAAVLAERPDLVKDDIRLALSEVQAGSLTLSFTTPIPQVVIPTFEQVAEHIHDERLDLLPVGVREALAKIGSFARRNDCQAELRTSRADIPLATIAQSFVLPAAERVSMVTTLYGSIDDAGGKAPNVHLDLIQGGSVVCSGTHAQVQELAQHLYGSIVGLTGTADVDMATMEITNFKILEILPYEDSPFSDALQELRAAVGARFDDVNANAYVATLRSDDGEE